MRARTALVAVLALALVMAPAADARTDNRRKPVVFVHGLDWQGNPGDNCDNTFGDMRRAFRGWGHEGEFTAVKYYEFDEGCDHGINHHGSHGNHYGSGHYDGGGHGANTDIRHLGYHFAWYVYAHYSRAGADQPIDVVAHSMGGLIARYAIAQTQRNHPDFPPRLLVEDVVTLGTPHGGARWYSWGCPFTQCDQMVAGSDFLVWLENNAWEPDGEGGTDWSTFGSDDDNAVAADRAAATARDRDPVSDYMGSCHKVWYRESMDIEHSDYMHDTSEATNADVYRRNCPDGFVTDNTSHHPVRRADLAITFGSH